MPTIELSDAVYGRLLRRATSFEDSAEDVVLRLLGDAADGGPAPKSTNEEPPRHTSRATPGSILPQQAYWKPMLEIIVERGGSAPAGDVIEELGERLKDSLTPLDRKELKTGALRWRNRARFARLRMTEQGLLSPASQYGVWEITDAGREYLKRG